MHAERVAGLSARCKSLEGTIAERDFSVTVLGHEFCALQTHAANILAAMAARDNAGSSVEGHVQELQRSLLAAEQHQRAVQSERRTLKDKVKQMLDIRRGFEGQVEELSTEPLTAQVEATD